MCVAVLVETPQGPTDSDLYHMNEDNPHGVGVAWAMGDLVRYKKGLTWQQARDLLQAVPRPALLHFRWATHGSLDRVMTHPFPIGRRALTSRKLNGAAKAVLIHNGIWRDYAKFAPKGTNLATWSDTAVAAWAAGEYGEDILDHVDWATAVGRAGGNGRLDVTLRGCWEAFEGNLYSNLTWRPRRKMRVNVTPSGSLEFLEDDAWTEYFERVTQPSHSAYDDDPLNLDFPHWDSEGRLVRRGRANVLDLAPTLAPPVTLDDASEEQIDTWLAEYQAANDACAKLPTIKVAK